MCVCVCVGGGGAYIDGGAQWMIPRNPDKGGRFIYAMDEMISALHAHLSLIPYIKEFITVNRSVVGILSLCLFLQVIYVVK